jgi:hypothetical protein
MAVSPACVAAVRQASGDSFTESEAADLIRRMEKRVEAERAAGRLDRLDDRVRELAAQDAEQAKIAAALARKHAALSAIAFDRGTRKLEALRAAGLTHRKAYLAFFEGTTRDVAGGRESVAATALAYRDRYFQAMNLYFMDNPEVARLVQSGDPGFSRAVVREMRELRADGKPGVTGNREAQALAKIYADIADRARLDLNRHGATIGRLEGWSPQAHASERVVKVSAEEWVDYILPRLDRGRSFAGQDDDQARMILRDIYQEIVTGMARNPGLAEQTGRLGPANLANSLGRSRVLHFQDSTAWIQYAERFGTGNVHEAMLSHLLSASKTAAQLQWLGPNPAATETRLRAFWQRQAASDRTLTPEQRARQARALEPGEGGSVGSAWAEVSGASSSPASIRWAQIGTAVRSWQTLAKLGGAVVSSITDLPLRAAALTAQGQPIGRAWAESLGTLFNAGGREARETAAILNAGFDGMRNSIIGAGLAEDLPMGTLHRITSFMFRIQGMTWWSDRMKAGAAQATARWMGYHAGTTWQGLPARYRAVLSQQGITGQEWELVRGLARRAEDGETYITPDRVAELTDRQVAGLARQQLAAIKLKKGETLKLDDARAQRVLGDARLALEIKLRRFFADEVGFAFIETDSASRRLTTWGTRPGTVNGELFRAIGQFKGFPIAFTQRVLGRALLGYSPEERALQARNLGVLLGGLLVTGYLAMTAKDFLRGYGPRDPTNPNTMWAALLQSGGAGIYGDFLFAQGSRFGNSALETVAGPVLGTAAGAANLFAKARNGEAKAGEALSFALQNTPFLGLWYARPALDMLVLNSLRESLSPGFMARQRRNRMKDYGQEPHGQLPATLF